MLLFKFLFANVRGPDVPLALLLLLPLLLRISIYGDSSFVLFVSTARSSQQAFIFSRLHSRAQEEEEDRSLLIVKLIRRAVSVHLLLVLLCCLLVLFTNGKLHTHRHGSQKAKVKAGTLAFFTPCLRLVS